MRINEIKATQGRQGHKGLGFVRRGEDVGVIDAGCRLRGALQLWDEVCWESCQNQNSQRTDKYFSHKILKENHVLL